MAEGRKIAVAITQMASAHDWAKNCDKAEALTREAAKQGAHIVLLQELFDGDYFCIEQHAKFLGQAVELDRHPTVQRFAALAKELGVVLPVSVFERAGNAHYNTTVIVDADGKQLGHYRKTHIPDGRGYQEKFYFSPGDTGFKVWDTAAGKIGLGICWDQWFPECARAMALQGAEMLLYPTAIGDEPQDPSYDSSDHWQTAMRGHAAANMVPVAASNRIGSESDGDITMSFYGSSFIAGPAGEVVAEASRDTPMVITATFDLDELRARRASWGLFRDRRTDLYRPLLTPDGSARPD